MKLNNKGMSIIEVIITFALIMSIVTGLLVIIANYRNKMSVSLERLSLDTFKDNITQDVYNDILNKGIKDIIDITDSNECNTISLQTCIEFTFKDDTTAILGVSRITPTDKDKIENKYLYYDGIKYPLKDRLPSQLPTGRKWGDLAAINIEDTNALKKSTTTLEDGTPVNIYAVDIEISHIDFKEDFGIHLVATDTDISL